MEGVEASARTRETSSRAHSTPVFDRSEKKWVSRRARGYALYQFERNMLMSGRRFHGDEVVVVLRCVDRVNIKPKWDPYCRTPNTVSMFDVGSSAIPPTRLYNPSFGGQMVNGTPLSQRQAAFMNAFPSGMCWTDGLTPGVVVGGAVSDDLAVTKRPILPMDPLSYYVGVPSDDLRPAQPFPVSPGQDVLQASNTFFYPGLSPMGVDLPLMDAYGGFYDAVTSATVRACMDKYAEMKVQSVSFRLIPVDDGTPTPWGPCPVADGGDGNKGQINRLLVPAEVVEPMLQIWRDPLMQVLPMDPTGGDHFKLSDRCPGRYYPWPVTNKASPYCVGSLVFNYQGTTLGAYGSMGNFNNMNTVGHGATPDDLANRSAPMTMPQSVYQEMVQSLGRPAWCGPLSAGCDIEWTEILRPYYTTHLETTQAASITQQYTSTTGAQYLNTELSPGAIPVLRWEEEGWLPTWVVCGDPLVSQIDLTKLENYQHIPMQNLSTLIGPHNDHKGWQVYPNIYAHTHFHVCNGLWPVSDTAASDDLTNVMTQEVYSSGITPSYNFERVKTVVFRFRKEFAEAVDFGVDG